MERIPSRTLLNSHQNTLKEYLGKHFAFIGLAALCLLFLFYGLGDFRTLGSHEGYAAVPAKEMIESGDWIVPQFGHMPRLQKPPLSYWIIGVTSKLTVGTVTEWSARFPSAVSAILLACVMMVWATKWYGRKAGLAAGLIQATSIYVLVYGRKAEIEMLLCLLTTSAMFLIATDDPNESRRKNFCRWSGVFVLLSLSWLGKFHYGMTMVLAPVVVYFLVQKKFRNYLKFLHPVGIPLLLAAVFIWPYLVIRKIPEAKEIWFMETVGRASGKMGYDPFWFYLPRIFINCLPWSPLAIYAMPGSMKKAFRLKDARERFLWIWFMVDLMIITIQPMKHAHYVVALLPVMTLLASRPLSKIYAAVVKRWPEFVPGFYLGWMVFLALAGSVAVSFLNQWNSFLAGPVIMLVVFVLLSLILANLLFMLKKKQIAAGALLVLLAGVYVIVNDQLVPVLDNRHQIAEFARDVSREVPDEEEICLYKAGMDPVIFYIDQPSFRAETDYKMNSSLDQDGDLIVLSREGYLDELSKLGTIHVLRKMKVDSESVSPRLNDFILLELTRRQDIASNR